VPIGLDNPGPAGSYIGFLACCAPPHHRPRIRLGDWDFSAFQNIPLTAGEEFQFRAEFFNILNHPNFCLPDSDVSSPTFNQILAAQPPRLIQLALKFNFGAGGAIECNILQLSNLNSLPVEGIFKLK
jgi:hypothetical protein